MGNIFKHSLFRFRVRGGEGDLDLLRCPFPKGGGQKPLEEETLMSISDKIGHIAALTGQTRLPRRSLLQGAAALGLAARVIATSKAVHAQTGPKTLVLGLGGSPSDLDPH